MCVRAPSSLAHFVQECVVSKNMVVYMRISGYENLQYIWSRSTRFAFAFVVLALGFPRNCISGASVLAKILHRVSFLRIETVMIEAPTLHTETARWSVCRAY